MAIDPYKDLRGKPWFIDLDLTPTEIVMLQDNHVSSAGGFVTRGEIITIPRWEADVYIKLGLAKMRAENKAIFGPEETK